MSNRRKRRPGPGWRQPVIDVDETALDPRLRFQAIAATAPNVPSWGGGKWAMYAAAGCCWWTSDPADLARSGGEPDGLPCCPHCGAMLMQAPLTKFLKAAVDSADHYGTGGLATFLLAYRQPCHPTWDEYETGSDQ